MTTRTDRRPGPEQLTLLPPPADLPLVFRLSDRTRRVGLAGIARARAILDEQARARRQEDTAALPRPDVPGPLRRNDQAA
jgi:hypothetical protein